MSRNLLSAQQRNQTYFNLIKISLYKFVYIYAYTHKYMHTSINSTFDTIFIGSLILKNDHDISENMNN